MKITSIEIGCGCEVHVADTAEEVPLMWTMRPCPLHAAAPALLEACKTTQAYFEACGKAWAANDGVLIGANGRPVVEAEGLDKMCDEAEQSTRAAIAEAEPEKEKDEMNSLAGASFDPTLESAEQYKARKALEAEKE